VNRYTTRIPKVNKNRSPSATPRLTIGVKSIGFLQRHTPCGKNTRSLQLVIFALYLTIENEKKEDAMINFGLNEEEAKILLSVLENYRLHLEVEIKRTYRREFRDALKEREKSLLALIERLRQLAPKEKAA
jgi:hypothetical protein